MRSYRILSILATLVFALLLTTTDAYSKMNIIVHNGGSDAIGSVTSGTDTDGLDWFTVVPGVDGNVPQQVAKVLLFEGNKELATTHNLYKGDLIEILPPFPQDQFYSFKNVDIKYSYTGMNITYTHKNENASHTVAIYFEPAPVASFGVISPASGTKEPDVAVTFNDTSTNAPSSFSWNFGDGNTSTLQNPEHTFTSYGAFPVSLTVFNALGQQVSTATMNYEVLRPTIAYLASAGENGSISPSGYFEVYEDEGVATTFTIVPNSNYQVADVVLDKDTQYEISVLDDCVFIDPNTTYTFPSDNKLDHTIHASFEPIPIVEDTPVRNESTLQEYTTLQAAYNGSSDNDIIKMKASLPIVESLIFDRGVTVEMMGGYKDDYTDGTDIDFSRIHGNVIISNGTVKVSKVIIGS